VRAATREGGIERCVNIVDPVPWVLGVARKIVGLPYEHPDVHRNVHSTAQMLTDALDWSVTMLEKQNVTEVIVSQTRVLKISSGLPYLA
jgi:hypothetical protein